MSDEPCTSWWVTVVGYRNGVPWGEHLLIEGAFPICIREALLRAVTIAMRDYGANYIDVAFCQRVERAD
jgi:hypothetical protein